MSSKHLIQSINSIINNYKKIAYHSDNNYNIFKILNIESNEVKLHSAFIADLLNPKGSHGFKSSFLQLFLARLKITDFDYSSATIEDEHDLGKVADINGGRIDIDIKDKNGYHIIIENKIYARDQENQLIRYFNYGKDRCKKFKLYYLTLEGEMPDEEASCSDSKYNIKLEHDYDVSEKSISDDQIRNYYYTSKNNKYYGIEIRIANKDSLSFRYGIRLDNNIYGGFTLREGINIKNNINLSPDYKKYVDIVKKIDSNFINNDNWLGYKTMQPRLNFKNINEETCNHLSNLDDTVSKMVQNITDEINFFKDAIQSLNP